MVKSMTGYGRSEVEEEGRKISIEISTVNHRYCDLTIRLPRVLNPIEDQIRNTIKASIGRGKVEVGVFYTSSKEEDYKVSVNETVCRAYIEALREVGNNLEIKDNIGLAQLMNLNDVITIQKNALDAENVWGLVEKGLQQALQGVLSMRSREGKALYLDLKQKAEYIKEVVLKLEANAESVVEQYKIKLEERIEKLLQKEMLDDMRLATEVALFADRAAIDEELIRLKSHLQQLELILEEGELIGRKLDFLMQEMNREANTIASKAHDCTVTNYAVALKTEIEKMREQIQNIE